MARTTNNSSIASIDSDSNQAIAIGLPPIVSTAAIMSHDLIHSPVHPGPPRPRKLLPSSVTSAIPQPQPPPSPTNLDASADQQPPSPTTRRGRKPSTGISRTAREAARKSNHSRIEKLRREKINDALASLRELVPKEANQEEEEEETGGGGQKEFKLDILERTVVYLRKLKRRVAELEGEEEDGGLTKAKDVDMADDHREHQATDTASSRSPSVTSRDSNPQQTQTQTQTQTRPQQPVRLPSISSLLNASPFPSPSLPPSQSASPATPYTHYDSPQFPLSPPSSGRSRPYYQPNTMPNPPLLHLPPSTSPALHTSASSQHIFPSARHSPPRHWGSSSTGSSSIGTGNESVLDLYCSAERSSLGAGEPVKRGSRGSEREREYEEEKHRRGGGEGGGAAQTPASVLGIERTQARRRRASEAAHWAAGESSSSTSSWRG